MSQETTQPTQQVTQQTTTAPVDPQVQATQHNLLSKLDAATNNGTAVFGQSLFSGAGDTTKKSWQSALDAANSPDYMSGVNGALKSFGNAAAGNDYGMNDPGYATLRTNAADDAMKNANQLFNASGRFGGGTHAQAVGTGVTNALAGLDYQNFQNDRNWQAQAAQLLPGLFSARQLPSAAMGAVGAAQDANAQGILQGQNDLFRRQNDSQWDTLGRASSILAGTAGAGGSTTNSTTTSPAAPQTPWWQSALGLGIGAAGAFL